MHNIVNISFGSSLYGTRTATSDFDYKTVFIPKAESILLQKAPKSINNSRPKSEGEKNFAGENDTESFALHRYLELLSEGQTVALDMLFAPEFSWVEPPDPIWHIITENRHKLVTKKSKSFVGYCRTQANRYGIRGSRVHAVRNIVEFLEKAISKYGGSARLSEVGEVLALFIKDRGLEHTSIVVLENTTQKDGVKHLECCNRKVPFFNRLRDSYDVYKRVLDEYGHRAFKAEQNEGIDWKALSHAVRVGEEALELLKYGTITFPLHNADDILRIKLGLVPYVEVANRIEGLLEQVEKAETKSSLREEVDYDFINDLVIEVYGDAIMSYMLYGEYNNI